jgi:DNA modification methylase
VIQLLAGDCRDVLVTLPAESVQCCVTSPPYYGLRSYGVGAEHGEIGSEPTPDEYLATMVAVFREVRRVLRRDGTLFLNIGDSYASSGVQGPQNGLSAAADRWDPHSKPRALNRDERGETPRAEKRVPSGYKPKDLLMMPARLALALQADGWWVRSDIIWHKPNPMPESCTDRPTSAHEHVFLLTRSARYYYDAEAVREPHQDHNVLNGVYTNPKAVHRDPDNVPPNQGWTGGKGFATTHRDYNPAGRNLRNVWTIPTSPFSAAHFATYPPQLAERCILAGTSERGACSQCGKAWVRVVDKRALSPLIKGADVPAPDCWKGDQSRPRQRAEDGTFLPRTDEDRRDDPTLRKGARAAVTRMGDGYDVTTTGWSPACACNAETRPCVVLDPFAGAGTTLLVADRLQRDAIGIELNPAYTEMAMQRCRDDAPLFTAFPPADDPEEARMQDLFADTEYQRLPAEVSAPKWDGFRHGKGAYVNQGPLPSNGQPEAAD